MPLEESTLSYRSCFLWRRHNTAATTLKVFTIFRAFSNATRSCDLVPFYPITDASAGAGGGAATLDNGTSPLKATMFPVDGMTLWTVIRDGNGPIDTFTLQIPTQEEQGKHTQATREADAAAAAAGSSTSVKYFDVWRGVQLQPSQRMLTVSNQQDEYGAVAMVTEAVARLGFWLASRSF
jgi:hypothetical protein